MVGADAWPRLHEAQRRVLFEMSAKGAQSRVALARHLGLSRTSLTRLSRELEDLGLIEDGEVVARATRGRPREMLIARAGAAHFLGVKLTADALYAVVVDLAGNLVADAERAIESREIDVVVAQIGEVADELFAGRATPASVGVCLAGDIRTADRREWVDRSVFLGWDGVPLAELVSSRVGLPTVTRNDVHALAVGQLWSRADAGHRSMVLFGVGAGIGAGIILDGELVAGVHGRAAKIGHARVGGEGRMCAAGHRDCVHSFVTMPSIELNAGVEPGRYLEVIARARAGDARATVALERAAQALGVVVAQSVNSFDPEVVVITGEGADMFDMARPAFDASFADALEDRIPVEVEIRRQPFEFGLYARGAAVSAIQHLLR